jgi:hypothetical protein
MVDSKEGKNRGKKQKILPDSYRGGLQTGLGVRVRV